ncbi:MAG: exodeoxyribonuclease VII large subunit, partial [Candidatus Tumulicola sp.]
RAAGAEDFQSTLRERAPNVSTIFIETRVQGKGAELAIADALERASREDVDAVVLARGGGALEERSPFDTEVVVRAIVRSRHPVATAIGHTRDHHLADDVADAIFKTPTAAAEYIAGSWSEAATRLSNQRGRLARSIDAIVARASQRRDASMGELERSGLRTVAAKRTSLMQRVARLERWNPQRMVAEVRSRLARGSGRLDTEAARLISRNVRASGEKRAALERSVTALLTNVSRRLERAEAGLDRFDPLAPLSRGYAIVTKGGVAVRDAAGIRTGDAIEARLERGMLGARVESVHDHG